MPTNDPEVAGLPAEVGLPPQLSERASLIGFAFQRLEDPVHIRRRPCGAGRWITVVAVLTTAGI